MKGFYKNVDAILNVSTTEGAGLPVLEASAAGKLVFSTEVGHWNDRCIGVTLPMGKDELVKKAVIELVKYRDPLLYRNTCLEIQEHARSYDWAFVINDWIEAFS
jgi:glycosyltransferase involved in cell wall biosynthesis